MIIINKLLSFDKYFTFQKSIQCTRNNDKNPYISPSIYNKALVVNLVPQKCCPGNCIYCPGNAASKKTIERESFYPVKKMVREIAEQIAADNSIEHVILTGYGESTLNSDLPQIIDAIRDLTPAQITIKTCGALLWRESVTLLDRINTDMYHLQKLMSLICSLDPLNVVIRTTNKTDALKKYCVDMKLLLSFSSSLGPMASVQSDEKSFHFSQELSYVKM